MTAPEQAPTGAYETLATALVVALCDERIHCQIIATDGDKPRWNGGCPRTCQAAKWEDDFLDLVCEKHGEDAQARGALVVWADGRTLGSADSPLPATDRGTS